MLRESASSDIRFPATCARCGGQVAEQVTFCPHCGTHARLAFVSDKSPPRSAAASKAREEPRGEPRWSSPPRPLFASAAGGNAFANLPAPPVIAEIAESGRHWGVKTGTALALAAFVALYGSIVLMHRYNDASSRIQQGTLRTVEGTVQANATPAAGQSINKSITAKAPSTPPPATVSSVTPAPTPAPTQTPRTPTSAPAPPTDSVGSTTTYASPDSSAAPEQHARAPSSQAVAPVTVPSIAARSTSPGTSSSKIAASESEKAVRSKPTRHPNVATAPPVTGVASTNSSAQKALDQRRDASVARSIAVAQASLAKNNLSAARRALSEAQSAQPGNSEAFMLQQDLLSRERARDSALSAARICAVQQQWNCAWHQAGAALAADAGSVEAKALVQRSIVESGAATRPAGPGPDGPDVPMLAQ